MKWRTIEDETKRIKRKFAWVPFDSENGYTYWLTFYYVLEQYDYYHKGWFTRRVSKNRDYLENFMKNESLPQ